MDFWAGFVYIGSDILCKAQMNRMKNERLEFVKKGMRLWKNLIHIMTITKKAILFV